MDQWRRCGSGVVIKSTNDHLEFGETFHHPITILDCEAMAIRLALQTLPQCVRPHHRHIHLYSDCEVAIRLIAQDYNPKWGSTQQLILQIHQLLHNILDRTCIEKIVIHKVAAHTGIKLNELADKLANKYRSEARWQPEQASQWTKRSALSFKKKENQRLVGKRIQTKVCRVSA